MTSCGTIRKNESKISCVSSSWIMESPGSARSRWNARLSRFRQHPRSSRKSSTIRKPPLSRYSPSRSTSSSVGFQEPTSTMYAIGCLNSSGSSSVTTLEASVWEPTKVVSSMIRRKFRSARG